PAASHRASRSAPLPSRTAVSVGLGHSSSLSALAWSPNGKTLATGSMDQTVILWDVATWRPRATLAGLSAAVSRLTWSPNGKMLATSDGHTAMLWDAASGQRRAVLPGLVARVEA